MGRLIRGKRRVLHTKRFKTRERATRWLESKLEPIEVTRATYWLEQLYAPHGIVWDIKRSKGAYIPPPMYLEPSVGGRGWVI